MDLAGVIEFLKSVGIFEYYLPFIIIFTILYGLLNKSKIFGETGGGRGLNAIVSLAASAFILVYTPVGTTLTQFFAELWGQVAAVLVSIVAIIMLAYVLLPIAGKKEVPSEAKWIIFVVALLGIGMYISAGGLAIFPGVGEITEVGGLPEIGLSASDIVIIAAFIIIIIIVVLVVKKGGEGGKEKEGRLVLRPG
jgi:hypothetical protein